jgi:arylsulfatase A-like enzyme
MKIFKSLGLAALCIIATSCSETEQTAPEMVEDVVDTRPNILFIVADDLGFTDIGAFGGEIPTPNLDELAMEGLRLNNLHTAAACQSVRTMFMSSNGVSAALETRSSPNSQRNNLLKLEYAIIPELLQEAGYATYMTGKWDLGLDEGYTPATRGFDRSFVMLHGSSSYFAETFLVGDELGFQDDGQPANVNDLPEDFYVTEHYTDKMLKYLQSHEDGQPWFAYMPYTSPHWPLQLPDDWLDRYEGAYDMGYDKLREQRYASAIAVGVLPANSSMEDFEPLAEPWDNLSDEEKARYSRAQGLYAGMVEYLDMSIGRVISYLEASGQMDNTVIVFMSDHGASSGEHGVNTGRGPQGGGPSMPDNIDNSYDNFGKVNSFVDHGRGFGESASAPFKNLKGTIDEGGLRAAAFVHYSAAVAGGGVSSAFMSGLDLLPTFMEIAETEHPGVSTFRGREVKGILGTSAWAHLTGQAETVHSGTSNTVGWTRGGGGVLIRGDYKAINTVPPGQRGTTDWRLYNIVADPGEHQNLAVEQPELVAELATEWELNWK